MNWFKKQQTINSWPLDLEIARFGKEKWRLQDAVTGLLVIGEIGSGKSSAAGKTFARNFLSKGFGGLVLCFKGDEKDNWIKWAKTAGRGDDLRIFEIGSSLRFNFLDYESKTQAGGLDHIDNLVTLLMDIASVRRVVPLGNDASFWTPQKKMLLRNSLSLLLLASEPLTLTSINDLIQSAPSTVEEGKNAEWQKRSFLYKMLGQSDSTHPEFMPVMNYWMNTRAALHSKTRATIDAELLGMIDGPLSRGRLAELFGTTTNIDPSQCFDGKIIVVNVPVDEFREVGQYAALIWQTAYMRATMRRHYQPPTSRPVFLYADEAQAFSTDLDAEYHATCRAKGVACAKITQNIPGFVRAYGGGPAAQLTVDNILGNLVTKIFLKNSDPVTNEWASKVISRETRYKSSLSNSNTGLNTSMSEHEEDSCPPREFLSLKTGGKQNRHIVSGVVYQSGKLIEGERWVIGEFSQI